MEQDNRERQAGSETSNPEPRLDLTACDREPIHIPGSIQPHGLLLVAAADSLRVIAGAGDLEGRLTPSWLHRSLAELLDQDVGAALAAAPQRNSLPLAGARGASETFDTTLHRCGDRLIVELEPTPATLSGAETVLNTLDEIGSAFERASSLRALCERAAVAFRSLTGFDRVMIYRFLDDEAGEVVAEDRREGLGSFLNHHFPASDIPRQARALYVRNRVRVIPDIGYTPAPLRPAPGQDAPSGPLPDLDMSDAALRSVSPIHLRYLKNMGIAASASVSIVMDGVLWGLIACHHETPRLLPRALRVTCQALAGGLARQIRAKEEAELYRERLRLRSAEDMVVGRLGRGATVNEFLAGAGDELRRMLGGDGFAAVQGADLYATGHCPDADDVWELAAWVRKPTVTQPFSTHALHEQFAPAGRYQDRASGLLALTISTEVPTILLWFRAERIEVVNWAGNPHKAVGFDPDRTLTPRTSFEAWSESVRGRALPWTLGEVEAARRLTRILLQTQQNHRIRELNQELATINAENERLLTQKDYLLKEVDHRVKNSLQMVSAFLALQARSAGDSAVSAQLGEAQRRLSAVALVHRRLYTDDNVETVDLARYLEDLCAELRGSQSADWGQALSLDLAPILLSADRAVGVGLILTELVINANKYAYEGQPGPIAITLEQHRNRFRLIVADRGVGKADSRQGFGSRMLKILVERLQGQLEEESNGPGLRVILTAPVE